MCGDMYIAMTQDTPEVILNPAKGTFSITGQSMPENSHEFYSPIIDWLSRYMQEDFDSFCLDIKLLYFNTSSAKEIAKTLSVLYESDNRDKVTIRWFYDYHDPDNLDACKRYEAIPLRYEYYEYDFSTLEQQDEPEGTYHIIS